MANTKIVKINGEFKLLFSCSICCSFNGKKISKHYGMQTISFKKTLRQVLNDSYADASGNIECSMCNKEKKSGVFFGELEGILNKNIKNVDFNCVSCLRKTNKHTEFPWKNVIQEGSYEDAFSIKKQIILLFESFIGK